MDTNSENVVEVKDKVIERVKVFDKKKLAIIIPVAIILIAAIIVFANRNLIMGNYNCEKGNYQAAITYYSKLELSSQMQRYIKINFKRRFPVQAFAWTLI